MGDGGERHSRRVASPVPGQSAEGALGAETGLGVDTGLGVETGIMAETGLMAETTVTDVIALSGIG